MIPYRRIAIAYLHLAVSHLEYAAAGIEEFRIYAFFQILFEFQPFMLHAVYPIVIDGFGSDEIHARLVYGIDHHLPESFQRHGEGQ